MNTHDNFLFVNGDFANGDYSSWNAYIQMTPNSAISAYDFDNPSPDIYYTLNGQECYFLHREEGTILTVYGVNLGKVKA